MIRKTILTVFLIFPFTLAMSQISFGVKGGMNLNRLVITNLPDHVEYNTKSLFSYHAGVFSNIKLSDKFSLIPELQFIQKGYKVIDNYATPSDEARYKINYLEMPVMISYTPVKLLSIELGPTAGLNLGTRVVSDAGSNSIDDLFEDFEFGLTGGLRFNLNEKFSITGRYYYGLSTIMEPFFTEDGITGEMSKMYNHNIQCALYYVLKK